MLARYRFRHPEGDLSAGVRGGRLLGEFLAYRRSSLTVGLTVKRDADFQTMLSEIQTRVHDHAQND